MKKEDSPTPNALVRKRKKIDQIDQKLLTLLNERLAIALDIGRLKKERGEKIYNPKREEDVLKRLKTMNRGPLREEDLKKIFKTIMIVCRKSQRMSPLFLLLSFEDLLNAFHFFFELLRDRL